MESGEARVLQPEGPFKKCLQTLQNAKTDTEKFAALLVMTKVVKAAECSTNDRKQILDAIGFSFFTRLMQTKKVPEDCSPLAYMSVAVSVLCGLAEDPFIACCPVMKKMVPHLKEIMTRVSKKEMVEEKELQCQIHRDVYSIVSRMACTPAGGQMLLDNGYPCMFVEILKYGPDGMLNMPCYGSSNGCPMGAGSDHWQWHTKPTEEETLLFPLQFDSSAGHDQPSELSEPFEETVVMTLALLILLQQQFGMAVWRGAVLAYDDLFAFLAYRVAFSEDRMVFGMCELLAYILFFAPETNKLSSAKYVQPLMEKMSSLLRSKLGVVQRQLVLALINRLVVYLGLACLQPPVVSDSKFLQLVLSLTCVEVRIAVENFTVDQLRKNANKLCCYYNLLEVMVDFLCHHDVDQDLPLEANAFCQVHDAVLSASNGIFYLLMQIDSGAMDIPILDPVVVASVRMVAAVMCQAFTEVRGSVIRVLPFLLKLCKVEVGLLPECWTDAADPLNGEKQAPSSRNDGPFVFSTELTVNAEQIPGSNYTEAKLESKVEDPLPASLTKASNTSHKEGSEHDALPCGHDISDRLKPDWGDCVIQYKIQKQLGTDMCAGTVDNDSVKSSKSDFDVPGKVDYERLASEATGCGTPSPDTESPGQMSRESDSTKCDPEEAEQAFSDRMWRLKIKRSDSTAQSAFFEDVHHKADGPDTSNWSASVVAAEGKTKSNASVSGNVEGSVGDFEDPVPLGEASVKPDIEKTSLSETKFSPSFGSLCGGDSAAQNTSVNNMFWKPDTRKCNVQTGEDETAFSKCSDTAYDDELRKDMKAVESAASGDLWGGAKPKARKTDLLPKSLDNTPDTRDKASCGFICEELGQRSAEEVEGRDDARPVDTSAYILEEEQVLPRKFDSLLKLMHCRWEVPQATLHSLEVIKWLMPAFHFICQDDETREVFVEQQGYDALIQFLLQRQSLLLADVDSGIAQEQVLACDVLKVLLQLVMLDETLGQSSKFKVLMELALATVPELGDTPRVYIYKGFLIAVGLALTQAQVNQSSSYFQGQLQGRFMHSAVVYMCQAPTGMFLSDSTKAELLTKYWHDILDVWVLSLELLTSLVSQFPGIIDLFLELEFIQNATRILLQYQGSMIDTEDIPVVIDFLETLVLADERAKMILRKNRGIELARAHGRQKLEKCLQKR